MKRVLLLGPIKRAWPIGVLGLALGCGKSVSGLPETSPDASTGSCEAPTMPCEGACVEIASNEAHCGACGEACPEGDDCVEGSCESTGCPAGQSSCGDMCLDLTSNPLNCGSCNVACSPPETCVDGSCECRAPARVCDGVCTDVQSSMQHCGACGNACAADEMCTEGSCESWCPPDQAFCGDRCANLSNDTTACGSCDNSCGSNERCVDGQCECPNDGAYGECNGECVDLTTSGSHCGACDNACPANQRCTSGACTSCSGDFFYCPSETGDPLATCLEQARSASTDAGTATDASMDADSTASSPDRACQCRHCLVELQDCVNDGQCASTWQCAVENSCTEPCWGTMGVCTTSTGTSGCFKFCPPSTGSTQTAARAEALLRCTLDNGCGI